MSDSTKLVMTPAEAARLLGIRRSTVYELARRGELPHKRFGRRIVIPRVAFDEWLNRPAPKS